MCMWPFSAPSAGVSNSLETHGCTQTILNLNVLFWFCKAITAEGGALNDREMLEGSQCFAEECTKRVQLEGGAWCLILTNADAENRPTNVTFHYEGITYSVDEYFCHSANTVSSFGLVHT